MFIDPGMEDIAYRAAVLFVDNVNHATRCSETFGHAIDDLLVEDVPTEWLADQSRD